MRQGEIWLADLNPTKGSEQSGRRPAVIISGDALNDSLPIVILIPISSKMKSYPTCVSLRPNRINNLKEESEAIPFQVRAVTKKRLVTHIGNITSDELQRIIRGLFITLTH